MSAPKLEFRLEHIDRHCGARCGQLITSRGIVDLPAFMPVGTLGTVKGLTMELVRNAGAQMVLANTYHLALRPGEEVVSELGGLHRFSGWDGPILTDSGGYQIFSLARLTKVTDHSARFRSHVDGREIELTPERSVEIQQTLGSDIAMVLDDVVALPAPATRLEEAMNRTIVWAQRCQAFFRQQTDSGRPTPALFAIVQGGLDADLRRRCAGELSQMEFEGFAIGGLSVGETPADMYRTLEATCPHLPVDKPRYLMGVGRPADLIESILRGVDLFDCVMPTRNGRNGLAFTDLGPLRLRNRVYRADSRPIQVGFDEPFGQVSRGYLRHLFMSGEMLGPILLSAHNLTYYQRLVRDAREAIRSDSFLDFRSEKMAGWGASLCPCPLSGKVLR